MFWLELNDSVIGLPWKKADIPSKIATSPSAPESLTPASFNKGKSSGVLSQLFLASFNVISKNSVKSVEGKILFFNPSLVSRITVNIVPSTGFKTAL